MSKVLVTGGAGFIGSHLVDKLVSEDHDVTVVDDLSTGNLDNLPKIGIKFYKCDISDSVVMSCYDWCRDIYDRVFHLAAVVGVEKVMSDISRTLFVNTHGTRNILEAFPSAKILIASSSEVYGDTPNMPLYEDSSPLMTGSKMRPRWAYACSKLMCEYEALAHYRERGTQVVIARIFNTSGPRQLSDYGMVLPRFVKYALNDEPIIVHGNGMQTRSFCHVRDTVDGLYDLMFSGNTVGEVFNVGNDEEVKIISLAYEVKKIVVNYSEVIKGEPRLDFMNRRVPSILKMKERLGWKPKYTLYDIICDIIDFMR